MSKSLEEELGFRVRGANVEWLGASRSGARPATDAERAMWNLLLSKENHIATLGHKTSQAFGLDAHAVSNSLGDPVEGGGELTERELRTKKLAGG